VALSLGLRRWRDVDLDARTLRVEVALRAAGGAMTRVESNPATRRRTLPLPAALVAAPKAHGPRQNRDRLKVGAAWQDWDLVFCTSVGTPIHPRYLTRMFEAQLTRARLPDLRFHDLRHSYASLLLAQNVHPRVVIETLGHNTIALTMNTYSHVLPQAQREAVGLLSGLFAAPADAAAGG
jgi:integrase